MGICCSKTVPKVSSPIPNDPPIEKITQTNPKIEKPPKDESTKEEKLIKVDSHSIEEIENPDQNPTSGSDTNLGSETLSEFGTKNSNLINNGSAVVRTSSCTRDEVEAILIQCGRLSRSSSAVQTPVRKYSGSKRSFDFDQEVENADLATDRESRRQSRPSPNRRRTLSRERERKEKEQNRSGSRERNKNGGGRRVSRSPGRRSESPNATCQNVTGGVSSRPGKMVSVPAMAMDKSTNGDGLGVAVVKKIAPASPRRSRSPAARGSARVGNDSGPLSLSRSNSRKAEQSPYRRNPLREIDQNSQKQGLENVKSSRTKTKEAPQADENAKLHPQMTNNVAVNVVVASEPHKPQALTRTRSSRLSRDLENLNLEPQNLSPPSSYTSLLLEDIQNFHNKTPNTDCLSKTCSILNGIADINSSTRENYAKNLLECKEPPLVEAEVVAMNDLMEPSFHKYVTVKRGNVGRKEEEEESSGSNSFTGGPQHWISSSLWETNSTDSTDCWTPSSRSNTRDDDRKKRGIDCANMGIGKGKKSSPAITTATI